jgi:hypothetical protein
MDAAIFQYDLAFFIDFMEENITTATGDIIGFNNQIILRKSQSKVHKKF